MRLINIHTLRMHRFLSDPPPYAILSHRWSKDEITYRDFQKGLKSDSIGYQKIVDLCDWLREEMYYISSPDDLEASNLEWVWVDTCCIDERSSAEVSEAINSMFAWYENSKLCIVYLEDIFLTTADSVGQSEWFSRGWTLQELLAPEAIIFLNADWLLIGHKCTNTTTRTWTCGCGVVDPDGYEVEEPLGPSLVQQIHEKTNIDTACLQRSDLIFEACIAKRMSWAAGRECSRPEDVAYSLLGIFRINMPIVYGEDIRAFSGSKKEQETSRRLAPLLASSPDAFAKCQDLFVAATGTAGTAMPSQYVVVQGVLNISAHVSCVESEYWSEPIFFVAVDALIASSLLGPHSMRNLTGSFDGKSRHYELVLGAPNQMRHDTDADVVDWITECILFRLTERGIDRLRNGGSPSWRSLGEIYPMDTREDLGIQPLHIGLEPPESSYLDY